MGYDDRRNFTDRADYRYRCPDNRRGFGAGGGVEHCAQSESRDTANPDSYR